MTYEGQERAKYVLHLALRVGILHVISTAAFISLKDPSKLDFCYLRSCPMEGNQNVGSPLWY